MTILDFIRMTRANWKLLILAVAVGLAVMALYTRTQPRIFASDASAYVSAGNSSTVGDSFTGLTLAGKKAPIYATFLGNRATQARVVKELGLAPGSGFAPFMASLFAAGASAGASFGASGFAGASSSFGLPASGSTSLPFVTPLVPWQFAQVAARLRASVGSGAWASAGAAAAVSAIVVISMRIWMSPPKTAADRIALRMT